MDDLIFTTTNNFLHHGIDGQKWGVQNGPPYPLGSDKSTGHRLKKIEKKSNKKQDNKINKQSKKDVLKSNKSISEFAKKHHYDMEDRIPQKELSKFKDDIKNALSEEDINEFKNAYKNWKDKEYTPFYDDEEAWQESEEYAYNETLKYFKKNDPEYLDEIIKMNNGSDVGLDMYHDFRKTYEGFHDTCIDDFEKKYNEKHGINSNSEKEEQEAWTKFYDISDKTYNKLFGSYYKDLNYSEKASINKYLLKE